MQQLTYRQAYDKIIDAYFKDEIKPNSSKFCFCGNLNENNNDYWVSFRFKNTGIYYLGTELQKMEDALFTNIEKIMGPIKKMCDYELERCPLYEDALFAGMCAALEVLKQIHRDRGENVDEEIPAFTKRQLVKDH